LKVLYAFDPPRTNTEPETETIARPANTKDYMLSSSPAPARRALARLEQFLAGRARRRAAAASEPTLRRSSPFSSSSSSASQEAPQTTANLSAAGTRAVLRLRGKGALQFLQGMITNDVRPLMGPSPRGKSVAYAALLTAKGKLIEDVFVHRVVGGGSGGALHPSDDAEGETLLLDVGAAAKREALAWLARYRLRRPISLEDASSDMHVWAAWGGAVPPATPGGGGGTAEWRADPRLPAAVLGWRGVFGKAGDDSAASAAAAAAASHRRLRYALAVPEGAAEMLSSGGGAAGGGGAADNAASSSASAASSPQQQQQQQQRAPNPLEFGLDVLNGVSYDKGCYIGQERNSFTHYRGVIRRRALPVRLVAGGGASSASAPVIVAAGAPVLDRAGRLVGTIMAAEGDLGLAHLTLARALPGGDVAPVAREGEDEEPAFVVAATAARGGSGGGTAPSAVGVVPLGRPAWWPAEWGREELQQQQQQQHHQQQA
jgi:folate-binding protein YgfZ